VKAAAAAGTSETHGNGVKYLCETVFFAQRFLRERVGGLLVGGWVEGSMDGWVWVVLVWGERTTRTRANGLLWVSAEGVRNGNRAWRLDARRIHRTAATTTPPRRYAETLLATRRTAVAAHARPRIELYATSPRHRRRRHGRRPETPPERSSAAAAVSRGTRVIVTALTHRTDLLSLF